MIGTAAGLSFVGKLPFLCSFGCFITGRYDTIRLSVAYSQANIRLIGTHSGVGIGDDGHSQMGLEDIALMRALPTMGVFQPMDAQETEHIMNYLVHEWKGPAYLRLTRQDLPDLFSAHLPFRPGKLMPIFQPIHTGHLKIACIASGATVAEAVQAAKALEPHGIAMSVWNAHCLKPFDQETLMQVTQQMPFVVTVEDHSIVGGLGSCVADAFASYSHHPRLIRLGIQNNKGEDTFGESGMPDELYEKFNISSHAIVKRVKHESMAC
jgi:transketolase